MSQESALSLCLIEILACCPMVTYMYPYIAKVHASQAASFGQIGGLIHLASSK